MSSLFELNNTKSESAEEEDVNLKALELMYYHEKITGKVGGCDYVALRSAINLHGEKRVKMAMDIGFENNCEDIKYAIGVLKNWRREGCPKYDIDVKTIGVRSTGKDDIFDFSFIIINMIYLELMYKSGIWFYALRNNIIMNTKIRVI
jgi:hypothetical protein